MAIKARLLASGFSAEEARNIGGGVTDNLTGGGASQAAATLLPDDVNVCRTAGSGYFILRPDLTPGDTQVVVNATAATIAVYPPVGGRINPPAGALNAAYSISSGYSGVFFCLNGLDFSRIVYA